MTTIDDIAHAAGVSPATVSRVVNHPDIVAESTRARVQDAIERLDYRPNRAARALRTHQFSSVAVGVGDASNPFFAQLTKSIQRVGEAHGSTVILYDLDHRGDRLLELVRSLSRWGVDGAILLTGDDLALTDGFARAAQEVTASTPLVLGQRHGDLPAVVSDHAAAGRQAVEHLVDVGVTRPVFVGDLPESFVAVERLDGFLAGVRAHGLAELPPAAGPMSYETGHRGTHELCDTHEFDGLVAANDQVAAGALRALSERGRRVPDDVAVIGFDGLEFSDYTTPSLSTLALDIPELGFRTARMLFALIAGDDGDLDLHQELPYELVVRESTTRA